MQNHADQLLYRREDAIDCDAPFSGDLFERKMLATRLTTMLERLPDGGVIAIDAAWGEGKSWFVRNWHADLIKNGFTSVYIDAFQQDYVEDPFVMLTGALLSTLKHTKPEASKSLGENALKVAKVLAPMVIKVSANAASKLLTGTDVSEFYDSAKDAMTDGTKDLIEKALEKRIANYDSERDTITRFRLALEQSASEGDHPIVIFVDELDRCRPDFAVKTIERIKHFFEVSRVVFVLALNHTQLVASVKGIYGESVDGDAYLGKFIQFSVELPRQRFVARGQPDDLYRYCLHVLSRLGFPMNHVDHAFSGSIAELGGLFRITLRDVERAAILYSLAAPARWDGNLLAWPILLKLKRPDLFNGVMEKDVRAHGALRALLDPYVKLHPDSDNFRFFAALHSAHEVDDERRMTETVAQRLSSMSGFTAKDFPRILFESVNLRIRT